MPMMRWTLLLIRGRLHYGELIPQFNNGNHEMANFGGQREMASLHGLDKVLCFVQHFLESVCLTISKEGSCNIYQFYHVTNYRIRNHSITHIHLIQHYLFGAQFRTILQYTSIMHYHPGIYISFLGFLFVSLRLLILGGSLPWF